MLDAAAARHFEGWPAQPCPPSHPPHTPLTPPSPPFPPSQASDEPRAAAVVQYFKRRSAISRILTPLASTPGLEVLVADDSRSDYEELAGVMGGQEGNFLVFLHNLHEIR
eukprot:6629-Prorocentrum_minimum.AAC.1